MWNHPGPGIEPVSPALAGGFLSTVPPGKSGGSFFFLDKLPSAEGDTGGGPFLGQAQRTWWGQVFLPLGLPLALSRKEKFPYLSTARRVAVLLSGPQGGSPVPTDAEAAVGIRAQLHQAAPKRGPGGSGLSEALWGVRGLFGSRLDHKGPEAPEPLNSSSQHCPQSQPHPRSTVFHTRERALLTPPGNLGSLLLMWHHLGTPGGSFQNCVSPQGDWSQHGLHFTDEQTEAEHPGPVWPFIRAVNTYLFIEHRLCQALGGHRRLRDESHAGPALEALGAWQGSRSCKRTLTIQCGQCGVRGSTGDGGGGARRRGPWPSRGMAGGLPGRGDT